jgi:hypothetical protein
MTRTTICNGDWHYTKAVWYGTFTATNVVTGDTHDTGATDRVGAFAFIAELYPPAPRPAGVTYTISRGSRARAGHQRFPGTNHFE